MKAIIWFEEDDREQAKPAGERQLERLMDYTKKFSPVEMVKMEHSSNGNRDAFRKLVDEIRADYTG